MKKSLLAAAVVCFLLTSCKKEYTCECNVTSNMPGYTGVTSSANTGKMKKADAESKCNEGDMSYTVPGYDANFDPVVYNYKQECNIK